ncbi:MAG: MurR/RpiR family transcriptional regulator [Erysipelotrichaceae bacterium]|nr:MurR/RpiR family transcriptional regulator [Erysipelotrichaceae bacterium]
MFLAKLHTVSNSLTRSELQIADYIKNHIQEMKTVTSQELAEALGIGQSTIIRFSKKLGYASFREFLADLAAEQAHEIVEAGLEVEEDSEATIKKIVLQSQDIAAITAQCNEAKVIARAAELLKEAKYTILFGIGSSNLFAEYLANQLTKMGLPCLTSNSSHTIYSLIDNADAGSVVFLISESGETREVLKAAKLAKQKGLVLLAMTRRIRNSLYEYADIILKTVSFETKTRLNVTTMRCSQLFLIDALYLLIMKSDFEHFNEVIERSEQLAGICNK